MLGVSCTRRVPRDWDITRQGIAFPCLPKICFQPLGPRQLLMGSTVAGNKGGQSRGIGPKVCLGNLSEAS
jgi:hypothetical protein